MRRLTRIGLFTVVGSAIVLGESARVPANWIGEWTLSVAESKVNKISGEGVPLVGLAVTGETLKIAVATGHMIVTTDMVVSKLGPARDEMDVDLDHGGAHTGGR